MWNNIDRRLKKLAKALCWLGIMIWITMALLMWRRNAPEQPTILMGFIYLVLGCLGSWIGSWTMYGLSMVVEYAENGGKTAAPEDPYFSQQNQ